MFDRFNLRSTNHAETLRDALSRQIGERKVWLVRPPEEPLIGKVDSGGFKIRWVGLQSGGIVIIQGQFTREPAGTLITVTQRPTLFFGLFSLFWLFSLLLATFLYIVSRAADMSEYPLTDASFVGFAIFAAIFGVIIFNLSFWDGARNTKSFLKLVFQADEAD